MKSYLAVVFTMTFGILAVAGNAYASTNIRNELSTAISQATSAKHATNLVQAQTHLRYVVDCLVGDDSSKTNMTASDPCHGLGRGAISDYVGDKVNRDNLKQALMDAQYGLLTKRLKIAQNAADLAVNNLKNTAMYL